MALRVLYFSRFLGGFGLGMSTALIPSYVSECTPKAIRGRCTGFIQASNNLGMMLSCECRLVDVPPRALTQGDFSSLGKLRLISPCSIRTNAVADAIRGPSHPRGLIRTLHAPSTGITKMVGRTTALRRRSEEFSICNTKLRR